MRNHFFVPVFFLCFGLALAETPQIGHKSLADAAQAVQHRLPRGVIVTGERANGALTYAAAGNTEPAGVAPEHLIFEIGSITKVFTSILLAQAVQEGKVKLESPLREVLGKDQTFADPRVGDITLVELATHTSGLPRMPDNLDLRVNEVDPYATYDAAKLSEYLAKTKLEGKSPYPSNYSNLGVGILGAAISRIYGKPWESLVAEKITAPLGMKETAVKLDELQSQRLTPPYHGGRPGRAWVFSAMAPAGALHSSASDLMILGDALLNPDKSPLKEAIEMIEQAHTPAGDIGLALMLSEIDGEAVYEHAGATGCYQSNLQVFPLSQKIRIVLINNSALEARIVLGATRIETPRYRDSGKVLTVEKLTEYEGIYRLSPQARFIMLQHEGQLWSQLTGQSYLKLFPHETEDRFFLKVVPAEVQFTREGGKIAGLTLYQNGRSTNALRTSDPVPKVVFRSPKELSAYAGTYQFAANLLLNVNVRGMTIFAQLTGQTSLPVFEKRDDYFEYDVVNASLEFERGKDGNVTQVKLTQNGSVLTGKKK